MHESGNSRLLSRPCMTRCGGRALVAHPPQLLLRDILTNIVTAHIRRTFTTSPQSSPTQSSFRTICESVIHHVSYRHDTALQWRIHMSNGFTHCTRVATCWRHGCAFVAPSHGRARVWVRVAHDKDLHIDRLIVLHTAGRQPSRGGGRSDSSDPLRSARGV